jgi:hypothetical protein
MDDFAGTYANPGYGGVTLCARDSKSSACSAPLSDYASVEGTLANDMLYAAWPRLRCTHVSLARLNSSLQFTFHPQTLFPEGYGKNTTAFLAGFGYDAHAEFGLGADGKVNGLGVIFQTGTERERLGRTPEERAEVWFVKQ